MKDETHGSHIPIIRKNQLAVQQLANQTQEQKSDDRQEVKMES